MATQRAGVSCRQQTPIVARTVLHKRDQVAARRPAASRHLIDNVADYLHNVDVALLIPATDVISLPHPSSGEHGFDRLAVILHVKPVAYVRPVSVHRQWFAFEAVQDYQRN